MEYFNFTDDVDPEIVESIIKEGLEINHENNNGVTVLLYAAKNPTTPLEVFDMILKAGANVNHVNK